MIKMREIHLSFEDFNKEMEELGGSKIIKISEPENNIIRVYYDSTWLEQREIIKTHEQIDISKSELETEYSKSTIIFVALFITVILLMLMFYIVSSLIDIIL